MQTEETTAYKDYIRKSLEEWRTLDNEDIQMDKFFSVSNLVYKATATKDVQPKSVVFKKVEPTTYGIPKEYLGYLGLGDDNLVTNAISNSGYGPKVLANDEEFRIIEYVNAQKIGYDDLSKIEIKRWHVLTVANFNKLKVEGFKKRKPFDSEANFTKYLQDIEGMFAKFESQNLEVVNEAKNITSRENAEFLKKLVHEDEEFFCQGDQNFNNILVSKENGKVTLVDYELACHSFKADDIGCFLFYNIVDIFHPEPPHIKVYEENYPSEELYRELAEYYVVFFDMDDETVKTQGEKMIYDKNLLDEYVKGRYDREVFETEVKKIVHNLKISICGAALWLMKQCLVAPAPMLEPGISYVKSCYQVFLKMKENLRKEAL